MEIAYLSSSGIPSLTANSIHAMKMCAGFVSAGHSVRLYCAYGTESVEDEYKFYGVERCFGIVKSRYPRGWLGGLIYGLQIWYLFRMGGSFSGIIYSRNIYALTFILTFGIPFIYEVHSSPGMIRAWVEGWLFSRSEFTRLVVISNALKEKYLALFDNLIRCGPGPVLMNPSTTSILFSPLISNSIGSIQPDINERSIKSICLHPFISNLYPVRVGYYSQKSGLVIVAFRSTRQSSLISAAS